MNYLMDQSVMNFAGTAARGSAIGTAVAEGMVSYLNDTDRLEVYRAIGTATPGWNPVLFSSPGQVLNTASTVKNDIFTTPSTSFVDVTGLSVSITPSSTSSRILVFLQTGTISISGNNAGLFNLRRGSTNIAQPATGSTPSTNLSYFGSNLDASNSISTMFLDSPNTTSSTTYSVQARMNGAGTLFLNRIGASADFTSISTITVMEISG
jgi:hypothetical protein